MEVLKVLVIIASILGSTFLGSCEELLLIDTDAGSDDATAILLLLSAWAHNESNFNVAAITCTYGNTAESNVRRNVLKTITIANASHIPVYGGAQKPLTTEFVMGDWFGDDGLGDFNISEEITAKINESYHAATVMVNLAKQYPKQLNILALGPLTNLALAISLDTNFTSYVKKIYVMGGSVAGVGNLSPGVEYNFGADPVSNFIVFNSTVTSNLLFPWETVVESAIPKKEWRYDVLGKLDSKVMQFLNQAERKSLPKSPKWNSADALTTAVMIWPELIEKSIEVNASPVMDGEAKGTILVDYENVTGKPKNVNIVQKMNVEQFKEKLIHYFS